ncbi:MAG: AI-2E family transporter [Ardenticatenaceae bacterium]|nr:AI-2E family transporter [Ardenticatenaceae bacterium]
MSTQSAPEPENVEETAVSSTNSPNSPPWSSTSKRIVWLILFVLACLAIYRIRSILLPVIMALVLAYLLEPLVALLTRRTTLPRIISIAIIYLLLIAMLVSIPVGTITPIVGQANSLINNTPTYLHQLGEFLQHPIVIAGFEIPLDQLPIDQLYTTLTTNFVSILQTIGSRSLSLFGSVASATISTVGWTILVLFLSFYLVKDHEQFFQFAMENIPPSYQKDMLRLSEEISRIWNAFLRGQLILCGVVGLIVFIMALVIGLPNALILGLIAALMELIPTFGPILAAIPAGLIGLFQSQSSWLGSLMSPFWFFVVIAVLYTVIYQMENYYLVPRIIGHHLKLHPLVVILGVLAGASVAGVLGIILAAPTLATARLVFIYIYRKLTDQPPFPDVAHVKQTG